jgi:hypothetical protein
VRLLKPMFTHNEREKKKRERQGVSADLESYQRSKANRAAIEVFHG